MHGAAYSDLILHRMLKDMSAISTDLGREAEPSLQANWVMKRVQFMAYDLRMHTPYEASPSDLCSRLNRYFFQEKKFVASPRISECKDPVSVLLLHRVLTQRTGSPIVLSLIYSFLAAQIGLRLEFVDLRPTCFLKFVEGGVSKYIDLSRFGRVLTIDDLLESLHTRFHLSAVPSSALLESVGPESYMNEYLSVLKAEYSRKSNLEGLLAIQNALMVLQPSSMHLLAERALLLRQLGNYKQALSDLKRYFSFCEKETAPSEVVATFEELRAIVDRSRGFQLV